LKAAGSNPAPATKSLSPQNLNTIAGAKTSSSLAMVAHSHQEMRDRRLQHIEAFIKRQQRIPAKGNDSGLLLDGEYR
ncbi:hypothetical protein J5277_31105, partial [Rhizobium sp. 16-449-1b]|nr:hypothetical protein [Rhizobium sp. 16-449-1b]